MIVHNDYFHPLHNDALIKLKGKSEEKIEKQNFMDLNSY